MDKETEMKLDYVEIGKRVRRFRKANRLSQEQLAEKVGISCTHLSHIETANTKLSLPVFVNIARTLGVRTDQMLYDEPPAGRTHLQKELEELFGSCSERDMCIMADIIRSVKISLDKYCGTDSMK